ncbi:YrdB family protein [Streptomyces sp. NBC_00154]|uniref:YrdB family protein n=1 Tax=Streptomyces sp. NBC_00154 TaxID=2975670 RepID=UPI00224F79C6|nr:YrdB family protein [Streptomyces sp. NBC_00154]MCX5311099.1 YrdB family protein [Streptomyces sp. NBC_00154]
MTGRPWWAANEVLAFVVELAALACLSWWGFHAGGGNLARQLLLAFAIPALAIALWGLFAAPRARIRLPLAGVLSVKAVVLGGGAFGLYRVGHPAAAVALAVVMVANTGLAETFRHKPAPGKPHHPRPRADDAAEHDG